MARNYDTTNSKPYPRVARVEITYSEAGTPCIEYVEQMAIVDADSKVQHLAVQPTRHALDLATIGEPVQIVHPTTGQQIGQTVTSQQLMLGLLAFLRTDQVRRDAALDAVIDPAGLIDPAAV